MDGGKRRLWIAHFEGVLNETKLKWKGQKRWKSGDDPDDALGSAMWRSLPHSHAN